jgi:hypothetical protein
MNNPIAAPVNEAHKTQNPSIKISNGTKLCEVGSICVSMIILIMIEIITPIVVTKFTIINLSFVDRLYTRASSREMVKGIERLFIWLCSEVNHIGRPAHSTAISSSHIISFDFDILERFDSGFIIKIATIKIGRYAFGFWIITVLNALTNL